MGGKPGGARIWFTGLSRAGRSRVQAELPIGRPGRADPA